MIYDIAVVGGGPAAATFARRYLILCPGASLLLIDGQNEQHKKPCGGLLAPDSQKALAHFDLTLPKEVLVDPQIFTVQTIDLCSRQVRYYQRYYLNMDRYAFDRWLLSLVPSHSSCPQRGQLFPDCKDGWEGATFYRPPGGGGGWCVLAGAPHLLPGAEDPLHG